MSDSVRPHRQQPTRLPRPWGSPGKNTGVGCPFLLQCMKVKSESEVAQLCPTLHHPMDGSPPGSSVHGNFQARVLEWGAIATAAKLLQSCLTVLPHRLQPTRFLCPWDSPGKNIGVGCLVLLQGMKAKRFRLFVTSWTIACQALLSIRYSRQEYWSGLPFPSPKPTKI